MTQLNVMANRISNHDNKGLTGKLNKEKIGTDECNLKVHEGKI